MGFLLLCLPIFGMVALGSAAIATRIMPPSGLDVLGLFSFRYALPALALHLIGRESLADLFVPIFSPPVTRAVASCSRWPSPRSTGSTGRHA